MKYEPCVACLCACIDAMAIVNTTSESERSTLYAAQNIVRVREGGEIFVYTESYTEPTQAANSHKLMYRAYARYSLILHSFSHMPPCARGMRIYS